MKKAFTLIELLVVVLIIGILAAIALPQYQKAVERAKMAEAVINVRAIANAHQVYYMTNGHYLGPSDMDKLDVQLQGKTFSPFGGYRVQTKDFVYAPNGCGSSCTDPAALSFYLGLATRINTQNEELYRIGILQEDPNRFVCGTATEANDIQKKLCKALNSRGYL